MAKEAKPKGRQHKLTMKKLMGLCRKELIRWKPALQRMDYEEQVMTILNMTLYFIYERNKERVQSLKFSDFLKVEPYLDHYLYRVCRDLEHRELAPKFRIYTKRQVKKFGVFDVDALEKKKKEPAKSAPKSSDNPWQVDVEAE